MTLTPERIGDKGQRFLVETLGYPHEYWSTFACHSTLVGAKAFAVSLQLAPGLRSIRVTDRKGGDVLWTRKILQNELKPRR